MDRLSRDDADRVLDGSVERGDPRLGSLASFVDETREIFTRPAALDAEARHLKAMAQQKVTSKATQPPAGVRRRLSRAGVIGAAAGVVFVAGSALAATGHLPAPAQTAVADVVRHVGVHVRGADHASENGRLHSAAGKERASENKARADAFTDAKKAWLACVALKEKQHTGPGSFDAEAAPPAGCGRKPHPQGGGAPAEKNENKSGPGENGKQKGNPHDGQTGVTEGQPSPAPTDHAGSDQGSGGDGVSGGHSDGAHGNGHD